MRSIRAAGSEDGQAASTTLTTLTKLSVIRDDRPRLELPPLTQLLVRGPPDSDLDVLGTVCHTHTTPQA